MMRYIPGLYFSSSSSLTRFQSKQLLVGTTLDEDNHDVLLLVESKNDEERDYFSMMTK